jgi:hypothetical protein
MVTIVKDIIKDENFIEVAKSVRLDPKSRINISKAKVLEGDITYHIYTNSFGQIILDPQVTIPASELWIFRNEDVLAALDKGMSEKQVINRGSFANYVEDES